MKAKDVSAIIYSARISHQFKEEASSKRNYPRKNDDLAGI